MKTYFPFLVLPRAGDEFGWPIRLTTNSVAHRISPTTTTILFSRGPLACLLPGPLPTVAVCRKRPPGSIGQAIHFVQYCCTAIPPSLLESILDCLKGVVQYGRAELGVS